MLIKQWEEFPVGPVDEGELHVTINRKGEIVIGKRAFAELGKPDFAVLLMDRRNEFIGVVPVSSRVKNSYPLIQPTRGPHRTIRASRFCKHYGIYYERTTAFHKPKIDEDGVLVLDLKAGRVIGKRWKSH